MTHSESINELATALAKAQAVMAGAKKDSTNPHFKSAYADLASIWDACRKALTDNGLSVAQGVGSTGDGRVGVHTMLLHSSGQWMRCDIAMKPTKDDPQGAGSALTYARRYALAAMVGVAPEDDDGNAASAKTETRAAIVPPAGYEDWVMEMEGVAANGTQALREAFMASKQAFIDFRTKHDVTRHEALKARAAKVKTKTEAA
jgi:hypothetical protein